MIQYSSGKSQTEPQQRESSKQQIRGQGLKNGPEFLVLCHSCIAKFATVTNIRSTTRGERDVSGALVLAGKKMRSRTAQAQAGDVEWQPSDDGGRYNAARFNWPTEAFNHFARNANFNRGGYRVLEDEWARDKRTGRTVTVRIVPQFDGGSVRPSVIDVWWTVDGNRKSAKFRNARLERNRGK